MCVESAGSALLMRDATFHSGTTSGQGEAQLLKLGPERLKAVQVEKTEPLPEF